MPSDAGDDEQEEKEYLTTETEDLKLVSDYSGLDFEKCIELDCYTYKLLLRDAYIYRFKQTKEGRDYLENCYILQQTKPNRKALKNKWGGDSK